MTSRFFKAAVLTLVLFSIADLLFRLTYTPPAERNFLGAVERAFASGRTSVSISELASFPWDHVCTLLPTDNPNDYSREELQTWTDAAWAKYKGSIPDIPFSPLIPDLHTQLALVFIKDKSVVSLLAFHSPGVAINGRWHFIVDVTDLRYKTDLKKLCRSREHAYLVRFVPPRSNSEDYLISISNQL